MLQNMEFDEHLEIGKLGGMAGAGNLPERPDLFDGENEPLEEEYGAIEYAHWGM
jgi:hypothetical protein